MKYIFFYLIIILSLLSLSCSDDTHVHDAEQEASMQDDHEEGEEVELTHLQIEKIGLELGGFEQKNLNATFKVNGTLEIPPQNKASVSTLIEGQVQRIHVKPGQSIRKGGLLATLQNTTVIEWQEQLMEADGSLLFLTKEYERQKNLVAQEIAAQKQLEKVESELKIAQAHKKALRAKLKMVGINPDREEAQFSASIGIRSPIEGFVSKIEINTGAYVSSNQELFEIVDNHHIHIDLRAFEKDLPYLSIGQKINFSLQSNPSKLMQASIFAIGKAMDEEDRTITIHAEIDNKDHTLVPGMYVEARIITEDKKVSALPESAIVVDKGLEYIFVKEEEHDDGVHFKKIQVITDTRDVGYVAISPLEPIADSDEIVLKGAYFLMAQTKKGEGGGGHHH